MTEKTYEIPKGTIHYWVTDVSRCGFIECRSSQCHQLLEKEGSIILDPDVKSLGYLRELLINDGPEFSYILVFRGKNHLKKYKIGVCVRGLPICKPL